MIRRLFWMIIGAVAGVTGYRRVSQLVQAMNPGARRRARRGDRGRYSGIAEFIGDVRDGMELYVNRRQEPGGPTREGQDVLAERPGTDYAKDGR